MSAAVTGPRASEARSLVPRWQAGVIAALFVVLPALYGLRTWLDLSEAWLHPELYGSSEYIWGVPNEWWYQRLGKALDWKAFDPNVNRVRPISDAADTFDTVARPYLTRWIGPHPSISPIAIASAVLSPLCVFVALRLLGLDAIRAASLTALFISSIAFLSLHIGYIRPAKKATMVAFCLAILLAQYHARSRGAFAFVLLCLTVFLAFFADELALGLLPVIGIVFFPSVLKDAPWWKRLLFCSLPVGFLVMTAWGLPWIYERYSIHGAWSAMADTKKFSVFGYIFDPEFYRFSLLHIARALLTTFGIGTQVLATEVLALLAFVVVTVAVGVRRSSRDFWYGPAFGVVSSALAVVVLGCYVTLLDFYPDISHVQDRSYLGSFMYYYHSPMIVPILLWVAYVWRAASEQAAAQLRAQRAILLCGVLVVGLAVGASFSLFHHMNKLVQLIHLYPYSTQQLFTELRAHHDELRASQLRPGAPVVIRFEHVGAPLADEYERQLRAVFGDRWQDNDYYRLFEMFKVTPIMQEQHLTHLVRAYYPGAVYEVQVR